MIPEAAVEAAAQLLAEESPEDWSGEQWANEKIHDSFRKPWRDQARRILEAAAPHIRAQALEDAADAWDMRSGEFEDTTVGYLRWLAEAERMPK